LDELTHVVREPAILLIASTVEPLGCCFIFPLGLSPSVARFRDEWWLLRLAKRDLHGLAGLA